MSANYSLVLLFWQGFDYEWVEVVGLLNVRLVAGVSSQLELLSTKTILRSETGETVQLDWIV